MEINRKNGYRVDFWTAGFMIIVIIIFIIIIVTYVGPSPSLALFHFMTCHIRLPPRPSAAAFHVHCSSMVMLLPSFGIHTYICVYVCICECVEHIFINNVAVVGKSTVKIAE